LATEVPFFRAIPESVSPLVTRYLEPVAFFEVVLAVDFDGVDFFLEELLEATVFLGVDEGVTFFLPLKE